MSKPTDKLEKVVKIVKLAMYDGTVFSLQNDLETFMESHARAKRQGGWLEVENSLGGIRLVNPHAVAFVWVEK